MATTTTTATGGDGGSSGGLSARRARLQRILGDRTSPGRAQTQSMLLDAGRHLIAEQGVGGTSVGDICSRAGFTRGAFYSNFPDMDHFVGRLAEQEWSQIAAFVRRALDETLPGDAGLPPGGQAGPAALPQTERAGSLAAAEVPDPLPAAAEAGSLPAASSSWTDAVGGEDAVVGEDVGPGPAREPSSARRSPERLLRSDEETQLAIAELAVRLLGALPVSRGFYLLQSELVAYILRDADHAPALRQGYEEFKASLRELLVTGLSSIARECLLSADDTTELIFAAAERSMRSALLVGDDDRLTAQLERTLPVLLTHLSRPATA